MDLREAHFHYLLQLGDNALILGHRLSEYCGKAPVLEQDIALTNIALDQVGQARSLLQHAAAVENKGRNEDQLAYLRDVFEFRNALLVEQPNEDFAYLITRQFLFDAFNYYLYEALLNSHDDQLSAIAAKAIKEITYHLRYSSEWMIRLGDGTALSHQKMQQALDDLWMYTGELITESEADRQMKEMGIGADLNQIKLLYQEKVRAVLQEATLKAPDNNWMQQGGKSGSRHSEHLGFILAELQFVQRAYPNMNW